VLEEDLEVDLLLVVGPDRMALLLADDGQHRLVVELGVVEAVDQMHGARARGGYAGPDLAGELGLGTGHEGGHLLVPGLGEHRLFHLLPGPDEAVDAVPGVAEDPLDAPLTQALEDVMSHVAHKTAPFPVVACSLPSRPEPPINRVTRYSLVGCSGGPDSGGSPGRIPLPARNVAGRVRFRSLWAVTDEKPAAAAVNLPHPCDLDLLGARMVGHRLSFPLTLDVARHDGALYGGTAIAASVVGMEAVTGRDALWVTTQYATQAELGDTIDCDVVVHAQGSHLSQCQVTGKLGDRVLFVSLGATAVPRPGG